MSMFLSTTFLKECAYTTQTQDWQFQIFFPIFKYLLKRLKSLDLVRRLRSSEYLLANTFAKKKWHQKWKVAQTKTMKAHSNHILDPTMNTPNGCAYSEVNNHNCPFHPAERAAVLVYLGWTTKGTRKKIHFWELPKTSRKRILLTTLHFALRFRLGSLQMHWFDNCNRVREIWRGEFFVFKERVVWFEWLKKR